jgi:hypothetical protein
VKHGMFLIAILLVASATSAEQYAQRWNVGCEHLWDEKCEVVVYDVNETNALLADTKAKAISEAVTKCQTNIDTAKGDIMKNIDKLSPDVVEAIKAEVKDQLKAEIEAELIQQISADLKSGKLTLPAKEKKP